MSESVVGHQADSLLRRWALAPRTWWQDRKYGKLYRPPAPLR